MIVGDAFGGSGGAVAEASARLARRWAALARPRSTARAEPPRLGRSPRSSATLRPGGLAVGNSGEVALRRVAESLLSILPDVLGKPGAVDLLEGVGLQRLNDAPHRGGVQRDVVRVAVHEAHGLPILADLEHVAGQDGTLALRAAGPVEHCGAR